MSNKKQEPLICDECVTEIKDRAKKLNEEQLAIAKLYGMTAEEYAEYM